MRLSKINRNRIPDKEKIDFLSGKVVESRIGKVRLLTKEEEMKYSDIRPSSEYYRVWIL